MSTRRIPDLDGWVGLIFDRPYYGTGWDAGDGWDSELNDPILYNVPAPHSVELTTGVFREAGRLLAPFDDDQVAQGLRFLCNETEHYSRDFLSAEVSEAAALAYVDAMPELFQQVFAERCSDRLGHLSEPQTALEGCCYMWWDVFPWSVRPELPERHEIDARMIRAMAAVLELPSAACQEAALHGLGHSAIYARREVEAIIDRYLDNVMAAPRLELRSYARAARRGNVN